MATIDTSAADNGSVDAIVNDPQETGLGWFSALPQIIGATGQAATDIRNAINNTSDPAAIGGSDFVGPQIPLDVAVDRGIVRYAPGPTSVAALPAGVTSPNLLMLLGLAVGAYLLLKG